MEGIEIIVQIIGTTGFPIAACVYMFRICSSLTETISKLDKNLTVMNERLTKIENKLEKNDIEYLD